MRAYRGPLLLPTRLPAGFVFGRWDFHPQYYDTGGRDSAFISFGRDGRKLLWGVYTGIDKYGTDCSPSYSRPTVIDGHRIYFADGIHGASAWECLPIHSVGNARPIEVELWYAIQLDSPGMRRFAMRTVATARLVRSP